MNELIENTLHIISKISYSNKGYLLLLGDQGHKILKSWGGSNEEFNLLNDVLFNLFVSGGIDSDNIASSPPVINLLKKNSSLMFINELVNYSEKNQVIYLLLFFDEKNQFNKDCKDRIISILAILSRQVKDWMANYDDVQDSAHTKGNSSEKDNRIFENWQKSFNLLIEASPDLIFVVDSSGKIILVNKTGSEILEYSASELRGRHLSELIDHEDSALVNRSLNQVLTRNTPVRFNASLYSKYEQVFPFEISCKSVTSNGEILGMIGICKDLSERKKFETELQKLKPKLIETDRLLNIERTRIRPQKVLIEELNRLKYEFISNISHEFRTTLASIIGFSETIESDPNLPEEMKKEFNREIMSEGKRLAKLINDVLGASQLEEGKIIINKSRMEVLKLIQESIHINSGFALLKNITLTYDHPTEEIFIEADKEKFLQVMNAMINNAIRFTNEYGRVKLIVNNLFKEVEIIVSDTGTGIPEGDLPFLFQKFYKVSRPKSEYPEHGVGLVFVKQIIDLHKGLITVQSELGSGTTFLVKLPKTSKIEKSEVTFE
ncbi:MAG: ATP-binding protein [Ignavibacteriales bacterium]